jgi:hypothetical protein
MFVFFFPDFFTALGFVSVNSDFQWLPVKFLMTTVELAFLSCTLESHFPIVLVMIILIVEGETLTCINA